MTLLYHFPLSPACRMVRVALGEKGVEDVDMEVIRPWEIGEDLLRLNPAGELPILILPKTKKGGSLGTVLCGGFIICEYLEEVFPDNPLMPPNNPEERAEIRRIIDWFCTKFENEVISYLVDEKIKGRFQGQHPNSNSLRAGGHNLHYHLSYCEWLLSQHDNLATEHITLADYTAAAYLSCVDYLGDIPWGKFVRVKRWYARLKSRPSFQPILADKVVGLMPPSYYRNPDF